MSKRAAVLILVVPLSGLGCHERRFPQIREDVALQRFSSCPELEAHVKEQALREMNAIIDRQIQYHVPADKGFFLFRWFGALLGGLLWPFAGAGSGMAMAGAAAGGDAPQPSESATDFTTTNTQEKGVDEADFVKNDGSRIFVLHDRMLLGMAAWPAASTRLESVTPIEGYPIEMFFEGKRLAVFSRVNLRSVFDRAGLSWPPTRFGEADSRAGTTSACVSCASYSDGMKISVFDVSGSVPRALSEHYVEGRYLSSRRIGAAIRVVTTGSLRAPGVSYWPTGKVDWDDAGSVRMAFEELRMKNRMLIETSTLDDWLPQLLDASPGGRPRPVAAQCTDFHGSNAPVSLGLTTVSTLRLDGLEQGAKHVFLAERSNHVYASQASLVVAEQHDWTSWEKSDKRQDHTYLHRLDLTPDGARYVASGGVPGHLLNQFSMGEDQGYLRVATTGQRWWSGKAEQANNVFVLAAQDSRLVRVGELRAIAPGERIYAARFLGSRGYLVTYKKVDPLFTLDLRSPLAPRIAGELKVTGYSTYIHPLEGDHLLTIGRDTIPGGPNFDWFQELTLQVFDVSSIESPTLRHKKVFGSRSSHSAAETDHKAFNYFSSRGLLAIPFSDYSPSRGGQPRSSLEVFKVSLAEGIAQIGSVDHSDLIRAERYAGYPWGWNPAVRRSVMLEDYVYSVSWGGLKVNAAKDLSGPALAAITFPDPLPWR